MKRIIALPICMLLLSIQFACSNGDNNGNKEDTTMNSTPTGPAPGNDAATNPSLADTLHDTQDTANAPK